jgi:protein-tyrosine phosphatase
MSEENSQPLQVLFVCMGNICRSPMAEGVFRHRWHVRAGEVSLDADIGIDSAGTHSYHVGSAPDPRAQAAALRRGFDISDLAARPVAPDDFERFDYILAMDADNLEFLIGEADAEHHDKIKLFLDYSVKKGGGEVPDPYYGGPTGFERVLDLIEDATEGLIDELLQLAKRNAP